MSEPTPEPRPLPERPCDGDAGEQSWPHESHTWQSRNGSGQAYVCPGHRRAPQSFTGRAG